MISDSSRLGIPGCAPAKRNPRGGADSVNHGLDEIASLDGGGGRSFC